MAAGTTLGQSALQAGPSHWTRVSLKGNSRHFWTFQDHLQRKRSQDRFRPLIFTGRDVRDVVRRWTCPVLTYVIQSLSLQQFWGPWWLVFGWTALLPKTLWMNPIMAIVYRFVLLYTWYRCKNCHIFADIFNKSSMLGSGKIWHLRNMEIPAPTVLGDRGSLKFMAPFTHLLIFVFLAEHLV